MIAFVDEVAGWQQPRAHWTKLKYTLALFVCSPCFLAGEQETMGCKQTREKISLIIIARKRTDDIIDMEGYKFGKIKTFQYLEPILKNLEADYRIQATGGALYNYKMLIINKRIQKNNSQGI